MKQEMSIFHISTKELIRTRLERALEEVLDKPLIMVVAPSGYGKTMLIRRYFFDNERFVCIWLPLQRDESDGNWLWRRICNKVKEYDGELYEKLNEIELPQSGQERSYVVRVLNEYLKRDVYFCLDDYQECNNEAVNLFLQTIIREVRFLHIVLISRTYPDIPYEELFLKGKCVVLNQQSLTLNKEETARIFELHDIKLSEKELCDLYEYTDGWISAVYLSLYEYQKRGSFGSFLGVYHLLKNAVFDKLTQQMQQFIMRVSLFDWFDREGAVYVTEIEISEAELFESVEHFGFIQYDSSSKSFQMHTLLRAVAEGELKKSDTDIQRLYIRAGEWAEKRKAYITSIRYYRKGRQWEKIAAIYAGEKGKIVIEQAPELFEDVKEELMPYIWKDYIMVQVNYLYYLALQEGREKVLPLYERTLEQIKESTKYREDKKLHGELCIIWSMIQFNDLAKMNAALKEACEKLGHSASNVLENSLLTYGTTCMTVLYYNQSGGLKETIKQEKEYAKQYMYLTKGAIEGWDEFFDSEYALLTGEVEKAYRLAEQVCYHTTLRQQTCIVISCYYIMLRCLIYFGKKKEFEEKMQEMYELLKNEVHPLLVMDIELVKGYIYACLGKKEEMPEWLRNFKLENCSRQIRSIRSGCMTYGMLLCREKDWERLDIVGEQMVVPYKSIFHIQSIVVGYIYKAIAKWNLCYEERAVEYLETAIKLAEPDKLIIPFWENGEWLEPIMKKIENNEFITKIYAHAQEYQRGLKVWKSMQTAEKPKLTKREKELMEYVRAGCRNAEISEKMHIALVTVEKNLTSIYRKLEVTNRTAAIRVLDELGE